MEAIVLAGGLGTRLRTIISDRPKVLAPIAGRPFLDFLLEYLAHDHMERIVLSVGYQKEQIRNRYGRRFGDMVIDYSEEERPLGTGGAIQKSLSLCESENLFVLNGDSIFLVPLGAVADFHQQKAATATLAVRKVSEGNRYGGITFDREGRVRGFREKGLTGPAYVNGGIYCLHRPRMEKVCEKWIPPFSIERDIFPALVRGSADLCAFPSEAFFIDIGVPDSWKAAQTALPAQFPPAMRV